MFTISTSFTLLLTGKKTSGYAKTSSFLDDASKKSPLKTDDGTPIHQMQKKFHDIYNLYKDSIVFISTEKTVNVRRNPFMNEKLFKDFFRYKNVVPKKRKMRGLGTGFIISENGFVCTNHHVVANIDRVTVKISNKQYKAIVVGSDPLFDIALLKIQSTEKFKPVYLGNSDNVKIGDFAVAIGNPFGLDKTYTFGIISATARMGLDQMGNSHIQTDAAINRGNSGGPLINIDGEVIGVNRAIFSRSGGNIGIGFAIPINNVKMTLIQLKEHGKVKRGYIGVQISPLSPKAAKELGLKNTEGALIASIVRNGPAYKAEMRADDIILKVNNKKIKNYKDLLRVISKTKIGKTIKVIVWRNGRKINLWITIAERPVVIKKTR